jgi:hypothetical protein
MAQIRPAARFPVIDESGLAHKSFEPFGLAHNGVGGMPKPSTVDTRHIAGIDNAFMIFEDSVGGANVKIDEPKISECGKTLRRSNSRRGRTKRALLLLPFLERSPPEESPIANPRLRRNDARRNKSLQGRHGSRRI